MKLAILGDTHFGVRNDSPIFHDLYHKFYKETFFPYLQEHGIEHVVQLGDLFDRRKYINFQSLASAKEYFFNPLEEMGVTLYTLLGNHDVFYKNTLKVNSTGLVLGEYNNIKMYDKPTTIEFDGVSFDVIPWICEENMTDCIDHINASKSDLCFGHFEFAGFEMDRGNICHEGMDAENFKRYELIMTGHFHHRSMQGNVYYIGTPYEMTWSDYNDPRGFVVFDTDTREHEFIENPHTIFRKVSYDDTDMYTSDLTEDLFAQYKGKYVKVIVTKKTNAFLFETYIDHMMKSGAIDVTVVEDFTEVSTADDLHEVDQADDTTTILDKYIDSIEIDLNKAKLKSIIKEVYTEALTIE